MLPIQSFELTELIFDAHVFLQQAAELERSEVDFPDVVVDFFQSDVFAGATAADVDPVMVPADTAVVADQAFFVMRRILEPGQLAHAV